MFESKVTRQNCIKGSRLIWFELFSTKCLIVNGSSYWSLAWINNFLPSLWITRGQRKKKKKNYNRFLAQRLASLSFFSKCHFLFWKIIKKQKELSESMQTVMNRKLSITVWRSYFFLLFFISLYKSSEKYFKWPLGCHNMHNTGLENVKKTHK